VRADVIVLGAGMVGVSCAVHLAKGGRSVVLVDRRGAGEETSFGNAGLIQREGVVPYSFPRDLGTLLRIAGNRETDARYSLAALPRLAPFLARYWWNSEPRRHAAIARAYAPLIEASVAEHDALAAEAGAAALIRREGWISVFRTPAALEAGVAQARLEHETFGIGYEALDAAGLAAREPHLSGLVGGIHWTDPTTASDPHALTLAYLGLFEQAGGRFVRGDALSFAPAAGGWRGQTEAGPVEAPAAVVALGPWADDFTRRLGYRLPLAVKRGYHAHYRPQGNAGLTRPVLDAETGFCLAPMRAGIRLTTGAEFAARDAARNPAQLDAAEQVARTMLPLAERVEAEPWMGARPCTPDMMPVIGPAPRHAGLWFAFGHAHHGFTLGPVTGRLVAAMVAGDAPFLDVSPYRANRF
jgi:D-amino-acid dehydrogenase